MSFTSMHERVNVSESWSVSPHPPHSVTFHSIHDVAVHDVAVHTDY